MHHGTDCLRLFLSLLLGLLAGSGGECVVYAEAPPEEATPAKWAELLRTTVIATVPAESVKDKHWGEKTEVITRYDLKSKNGWPSLRPQTRKVNHGLWQRHTVTLLDPEKTLQMEFRDVAQEVDGTIRFTMQLQLRACVDTDFAHWVFGVKGLNGTVRADVTVAALARCAVKLDTVLPPGAIFPAIQVTPTIETLKLNVRDIDTRQIGLVGGWAAEEIGDNARASVNSLLNDQTDEILARLRKQIQKNQDQYRVSPSWLNPSAPQTTPPPSPGKQHAAVRSPNH
ncbi:MAG: hypothetical protein DWH91_02275 [Planctomycetota bacterium]|nr:MAG: hypothetical protein DWH91_02275 [Planctomycetota bacterium]